MATTKLLRKLMLTAVLGVGALTSVAWGDDGYRYYNSRDEWRAHQREEARERRAREERRERERREHERREREWREHHWRNYDWR
jgi:hypothetical protein